MIPSASYPGKKTSLNQFSKSPPWKKNRPQTKLILMLCWSALGWRSRPAWQLSYEADKSIKWNKNLKKFVKTQGHNLKMSFLRPNLWIGLGFWVEKQILLWFLTWIVLTIFFEKEKFSWLWTWFYLVAKGNERHIAIWRKIKNREQCYFELL